MLKARTYKVVMTSTLLTLGLGLVGSPLALPVAGAYSMYESQAPTLRYTPLYVSGSGSDSNSGLSESSPFLTLEKAANYAKANPSQNYSLVLLGGSFLVRDTFKIGGSQRIQDLAVSADSTITFDSRVSKQTDLLRVEAGGRLSTAPSATLTLDGAKDVTPNATRVLVLAGNPTLGAGNYLIQNPARTAMAFSGGATFEGTAAQKVNIQSNVSANLFELYGDYKRDSIDFKYVNITAPQANFKAESGTDQAFSFRLQNSSLNVNQLVSGKLESANSEVTVKEAMTVKSLDGLVDTASNFELGSLSVLGDVNIANTTITSREDASMKALVSNNSQVNIGAHFTADSVEETNNSSLMVDEGTATIKAATSLTNSRLEAKDLIVNGALNAAASSLSSANTAKLFSLAATNKSTISLLGSSASISDASGATLNDSKLITEHQFSSPKLDLQAESTWLAKSDFKVKSLNMAENTSLEQKGSSARNSSIGSLVANSANINLVDSRRELGIVDSAQVQNSNFKISGTNTDYSSINTVFKINRNETDPSKFQFSNTTFDIKDYQRVVFSGVFKNSKLNSQNSLVYARGAHFIGDSLDDSSISIQQDSATNAIGAAFNLRLEGTTLENTRVSVEQNHMSVYSNDKFGTDSNFKNSELTVDSSSDSKERSAGGAVRIEGNAKLIFDSSHLIYTNPHKNSFANNYMPVIVNGGLSDRDVQQFIVKGSSVLDTPYNRDPSLIDMSVSPQEDKFIVTGGSFQFYYDESSMYWKQAVQAVNGDENGNSPLKLFKLADPSTTTLTFDQAKALGGTYTYSVERPSQDGQKYVFAPYYKVSYDLDGNGVWPDGRSENLELYSMTRYAVKDSLEVQNKLNPQVKNPQSPGRKFVGWKIKDSQDSTVYSTAQTLARVNESNVTYIPAWESAASYGVNYHNPVNGAVASIENVDPAKPDTAVLTYAKVAEQNYGFGLPDRKFLGWSKDPNAETPDNSLKPGTNIQVEVNNDSHNGGVLDLYAVFEPYYPSISFSANGGSFSEDSVFKKNPSIFKIERDEVYGGEKATIINGPDAPADYRFTDRDHKTLDEVLALHNSSKAKLGLDDGSFFFGDPSWMTDATDKPAAAIDKYRKLFSVIDADTLGAAGWFHDHQNFLSTRLSSDPILADKTYYVGWKFTEGEKEGSKIDTYFFKDMAVQADAWINSPDNSKRVVEVQPGPEHTFSSTAVIDMSQVKKQLTYVDKTPSLRNWAEKPYATAYPDARSYFYTELYIPEGVNADNVTVTPEGAGQLFVVDRVERKKDVNTGRVNKIVVVWHLKQSKSDHNTGTTNDVADGKGAQDLRDKNAPQWKGINDASYDLDSSDNTYYNSEEFKNRQINTYGALKDAIWSVGIPDKKAEYAAVDVNNADEYGYQDGKIDVAKNMISVRLDGLYVEENESLRDGQEFTMHGNLQGNFSSMAVNTIGITKAFDFNWIADQINSLEDPRTLAGDGTGVYATVRVHIPKTVKTEADMQIAGGRSTAEPGIYDTEADHPYYVERDKAFDLRSTMDKADLVKKLSEMAKDFKAQLIKHGIDEKTAAEKAYKTPLEGFDFKTTASMTLADQIAEPSSNASTTDMALLTENTITRNGRKAEINFVSKADAKPSIQDLLDYLKNDKNLSMDWQGLKLLGKDAAPADTNFTSKATWSGKLYASLTYIDPSNSANNVNVSNNWFWDSSDQSSAGLDAILKDKSDEEKKAVSLTIFTHDPLDKSYEAELQSPADLLILDGNPHDPSESEAVRLLKRNQSFDMVSSLELKPVREKLQKLLAEQGIKKEPHELLLDASTMSFESSITFNEYIEVPANASVTLEPSFAAYFDLVESKVEGQTVRVKIQLKEGLELSDYQKLLDMLGGIGLRDIVGSRTNSAQYTVHGLRVRRDAPAEVNLTSTTLWSSRLDLDARAAVENAPDTYDSYHFALDWQSSQDASGKDAIYGDSATQVVSLTIKVVEEPKPVEPKPAKVQKAHLPKTSDPSLPVGAGLSLGAVFTALAAALKGKKK